MWWRQLKIQKAYAGRYLHWWEGRRIPIINNSIVSSYYTSVCLILSLKHSGFQRSNLTISAEVALPGFVLWTCSEACPEVYLLTYLLARIIGKIQQYLCHFAFSDRYACQALTIRAILLINSFYFSGLNWEMVIELAWRLFFVNYLTDGEDKRRKVGKQEIGDLRSVDGIAGNGLRVARVAGSEFNFWFRDSVSEKGRKLWGWEAGRG